jgi:hypothetical protein
VAESAEITDLRTKLAEAKASLHKLVLGDKEEQVEFGSNRRTQWSPAKIPELRAYISQLEAELSAALGHAHRGPIYPVGFSR